jgi:hydroxyethylthiazole kinase-like sugar kinase family protein
VNTAKSFTHRLLILVGNSLTLIGCVALILGATGLVSAESFATGISSGVRVIGSVAITGCLLSAIGYGIVDYLEE